jgi:glyoxylase-like metal-dependent hydrolase (beta-lactamase superfamily II)
MIAPLPDHQIPGVYHRRIGDIIITAISDGYLTTDREMMRNMTRAEIEPTLKANFRDDLIFSINTFVVRSGGRTVLIDTGSGTYLGPTAGHVIDNLKACGIEPSQIDAVLLTHMHPDHSAGLTHRDTGERFFPNAELVAHENEPKHWFDDAQMAKASDLYKVLHFQMTRDQVAPYRDRLRTFSGGEVLPGITAIPLHGHTPGHTGYVIGTGRERLLIWGDIIHVPEIQFSRPEIVMVPDLDPTAAEASRRRILDMAAVEGFLVTGMHLHFPGFGHVAREGQAYRLHPEAWRLTM